MSGVDVCLHLCMCERVGGGNDRRGAGLQRRS